MLGFLDGLFDFDRNGELDTIEKGAQFASFVHFAEKEEKKKVSPYYEESSRRQDVLILDEFQISELEDAGLYEYDLEQMSNAERREAIEDAGLDPDDYL